jgi:hypothetical protein
MPTNLVLQNLEQASSLKFFFLFTSFYLIIESFFLLTIGESLMSLNLTKLKEHFAYILYGISIFALFASIVPSIFFYILTMLFIRFGCSLEVIDFEKENYINDNDLLKRSLQNNSSVEYQLLKDKEIMIEESDNFLKYAILFSLSILINLFMPNSTLEIVEGYLNTYSFLSFITALLGFALVVYIKLIICGVNSKVYYPGIYTKNREVS